MSQNEDSAEWKAKLAALREGQEMTREQARLALEIIDPGASNPLAICNELVGAIRSCNSHTSAKRNPAIRLMVHHLAEMFSVNWLAHDEWSALNDEVKEVAAVSNSDIRN